MPKPTVTPSTIQTYGLVTSAHRIVETVSAIRIRKPPIVGVPFLRIRWLGGPSSRIGCPSRCTERSQAIRLGPKMKLISSEVTTAPPERNVM